ncbi:hypothetical protein [Enterocloster sp.]|uniref:hypothetical protein n=1 Tax=Enterocloster sp. TaxID=2719315 RepID=UPI0039A0D93F
MANFEINEEQAALIRELRKLETSDPVHADVYNALFGKLINNDAFLERLANKMIEKACCAMCWTASTHSRSWQRMWDPKSRR